VATNEIHQEDPRPFPQINRLIHEPARMLILAHLSVVETADFLFLMNQTRLTRGNLSSHLSKLEAAGYVDISKDFVERIPRTLLRITQKGRNAFLQYRKNIKQVLDSF